MHLNTCLKATVPRADSFRCASSRASTKFAQHETSSITRRQALCTMLASTLPLAGLQSAQARDSGDWSSPGLAEEEDPNMPKFRKLPSGVVIQNLITGQGPREVQVGDTILLDYVLRRSNGYFIYSTLEGVSFQPADVPTGPVKIRLDDSMMPGLVEAIQGMKKGGRRRVLIPPDVGYMTGSGLQPAMPTFATSRQLENHKREPLIFELEVVTIKE